MNVAEINSRIRASEGEFIRLTGSEPTHVTMPEQTWRELIESLPMVGLVPTNKALVIGCDHYRSYRGLIVEFRPFITVYKIEKIARLKADQ